MNKIFKFRLGFILSTFLIIGLVTGCDNKIEVKSVNNAKGYEEPMVFLQSFYYKL